MTRFSFVNTEKERERAVLVGIDWRESSWPAERSLEELARLADTAGADVVFSMTQRLDKLNPKSFIGSGKVEELCGYVHRLDAQVVIFDEELSPSQQSHLEKAVGEPVKIIDRTALILDIFGQHAQTKEGKLQVQLAQLQYLLPRLRGMWTHLAKEQTRGGIGSRFGQGESQLEVDRRLVRKKISAVKAELDKVQKNRNTQSKSRLSSPAFRIALAGYTNAGKSSLLNTLTGAEVLSQDKLFATLDPTTRSYRLPGGRLLTFTDTVGFIQKLPHGLVDAFKSTLAEVRNADLILEIVDASDEDFVHQREAVEEVLEEIGASKVPRIVVFNKCDLLPDAEARSLNLRYPGSISFSARTGIGLETLIERIAGEAAAGDELMTIDVPYAEAALLAQIHDYAHVIQESYEPTFIAITAKFPSGLAKWVKRYESAGIEHEAE